MVAALGGPKDLVEKPAKHLAAAPLMAPVPAPQEGTITAVDTRMLGLAVVALGGGRTRAADPIDHAVGLTRMLGVPAKVQKGDPLAIVHARSEQALRQAAETVRAAYTIAAVAPSVGPVIAKRLEGTAA
jgi:thymidine phosphorylase